MTLHDVPEGGQGRGRESAPEGLVSREQLGWMARCGGADPDHVLGVVNESLEAAGLPLVEP